MTMYKALHPRDDIDRLDVSRKKLEEDLPALNTDLTYQTFYSLWVKRFVDIRRVIHNLSMLTFPSAPPPPPPPPHAIPRHKLLAWSRWARLLRTLKLNLLTFLKSFRCMTSFTPPGHISYLGFLFWHLWMTHPPRARVNTCAHVSPN